MCSSDLTYSGSPVACVASLEIIDIIKDENLTDRAEEIGARIEEELKGYEKEYDFVGDIRRLGNMVAVELVKDRTTKEPAADIVNAIAKYANDNGLLLITAGIHNNVIRFLTPLVITEEELEKGFAILKDAFESVK